MFMMPDVKSGTIEKPESADLESCNPLMCVFFTLGLEYAYSKELCQKCVCVVLCVSVCVYVKTHPENDTLARVDAV